jgi:hypothetical protein
VGIDCIAAAAGDLSDHRLKARILHLHRPAAVPADHVVVVLLGRTRDIGVLAAGQIDALELALLGEQVKRPENCRASDGQLA